jgi:hypothetical protein
VTTLCDLEMPKVDPDNYPSDPRDRYVASAPRVARRSHSDIKTTMRYVTVNRDPLDAAIDRVLGEAGSHVAPTLRRRPNRLGFFLGGCRWLRRRAQFRERTWQRGRATTVIVAGTT